MLYNVAVHNSALVSCRWLCIFRRLVMYSKCFRQLDLEGNLIGELGGFEIMRALTKREQRNVSD